MQMTAFFLSIERNARNSLIFVKKRQPTQLQSTNVIAKIKLLDEKLSILFGSIPMTPSQNIVKGRRSLHWVDDDKHRKSVNKVAFGICPIKINMIMEDLYGAFMLKTRHLASNQQHNHTWDVTGSIII